MMLESGNGSQPAAPKDLLYGQLDVYCVFLLRHLYCNIASCSFINIQLPTANMTTTDEHSAPAGDDSIKSAPGVHVLYDDGKDGGHCAWYIGSFHMICAGSTARLGIATRLSIH